MNSGAKKISRFRCPRILEAAFVIGVTTALCSAQPINPPNLVFATYVGPTNIGQEISGGSYIRGMAVDASGFAYVVGTSEIVNADCEFITKLNQAGAGTVWTKCLPLQAATTVTSDANGFIYVAGYSFSSSATYSPIATIYKFSSDGQQTIYTATLAGAQPTAIATDSSGSVYLIGLSDGTLKTSAGAFMAAKNSAFASKLDSTGSIVYTTYLNLNSANAIAVDGLGSAWLAGAVCVRGQTSVESNGSFCSDPTGGTAAFIGKLDAAGANLTSLEFGGGLRYTNLGRQQFGYLDQSSAITVAPNGSVWVAGTAESASVPTTKNALQSKGPLLEQTQAGGGIGYILQLSPAETVLYGSYLGSAQSASAPDLTTSSIVADAQSRPYLALNTSAATSVFSINLSSPGSAALLTLSADGTQVLMSSALPSKVQYVALDSIGGLFSSGIGAKSFLTTVGSYQPLYPAPQYWQQEAFLAKFDLTTPAPSPQFTTLVNAADQLNGYFSTYSGNGAVAPGELVTIYGSNLPANPTVTFDSRPAPILYSSATQINAIVPFEVAAPSTIVSIPGVRSYVLPVWQTVPGLFTANGSGAGQLAALNQDGSINSTSNPANAGSVISVFLTGAGATNPPLSDGQTGALQPPYATPALGSSATITPPSSALVEAPILFIGQAPGLIAGVTQVNIQVPLTTPTGTANVVVYLGNYQTQSGTIAVQ